MSLTLPIFKARKRLKSLPKKLRKNPKNGEVIITRHGKPVLAVLSWDLYESLMETIEIMGDEEMMGAIRQDIENEGDGPTYSLEEIKHEIGL